MDRGMLRKVLREILESDLEQTLGPLDDHVSLREELDLDSVALVNLVVQVQDQFQIFLTNEELEKITRVGELLDLLQTKVGKIAKAG